MSEVPLYTLRQEWGFVCREGGGQMFEAPLHPPTPNCQRWSENEHGLTKLVSPNQTAPELEHSRTFARILEASRAFSRPVRRRRQPRR